MSKFLNIGGSTASCECLNCIGRYTKLFKQGQPPTTSEFHTNMKSHGWLVYSILYAGKWYVLGLCAACTQKLHASGLGQNGADVTVMDSAAHAILYVPRSIWLGAATPVSTGSLYAAQVESKDSGELTQLVKEMMTQFHDSGKIPDTFPYQLQVEYGILRKIDKLLGGGK